MAFRLQYILGGFFGIPIQITQNTRTVQTNQPRTRRFSVPLVVNDVPQLRWMKVEPSDDSDWIPSMIQMLIWNPCLTYVDDSTICFFVDVL